ncbi:hypothetical protein A3F28_03470 [Candidatus Uhrbacteria bacterium RIFCSPHIGHO2_12_FULL_57_11]|uniref:Nudix hydrolase domain-containing protein n=2 Tax=Candidatus Uhriibacteriota TaxID=1752732 RepID=A0A1F7ULV4_9BACT|nr:MAG: hypothetical protein A3D72_04375 [Candidatus Uhrbacteria bacterium RIFCSPHIGHO2_02_FULL_57_19]OGL79270.1 MAG: hypothetical protein A3F28_03470 [Candidatus Uhrbacteria bacterium RIFCSPHIGHO2_12_FULL_57_11]
MKPGIDYTGISTPFYCHDGAGNFVLHKRSVKCRDEHGKWDCGGGQLHFGELPEEGVLREVREEYGCEGTIDAQLPAYGIVREHDGVRTHWLAVPFIVRVNREDVRMNEPEFMDEIHWFRLDALPTPLHSAFELALRKFAKHFKQYR